MNKKPTNKTFQCSRCSQFKKRKYLGAISFPSAPVCKVCIKAASVPTTVSSR